MLAFFLLESWFLNNYQYITEAYLLYLLAYIIKGRQ